MKIKNKRRLILTLKRVLAILPAFFWLILIFGFDDVGIALITLLSALLHEVGHIGFLVMKKKVTPTLRGALSGFRIKTSAVLSYDEERAFYFSGPLVNLVLFVFSSILSLWLGDLLSVFAIINLVSALSNLLPIEGYDGYGIIRVTLEKSDSGQTGLKILSLVSISLIFFLCIISLYLINRLNGGYWIFFIFFFAMLKRFRDELG